MLRIPMSQPLSAGPRIDVSAVPGLLVEPLERPAGVSLAVPDGVILNDPVRVAIALPGGKHATRVVVQLGEGSVMTVIEEAMGDGEWEHEVEVTVGIDARCEFVSVQSLAPDARCSLKQRSVVDRGGSVAWRNAALGGSDVTGDLTSRLVGEEATSDVDWLFFGAGKERHRLRCRNAFEARGGRGEILMKGIARDASHAACEGMIDIGPAAGGTDTYLTQDVLMLDPTAKVDAVPGLEIKTNDVKASHSAVVSRVTPEDLFYFASRGIDAAEARRLFIHGFLGAMADRMPHVGERVRELIEWKEEATMAR
jgi:Fe-S cluster assembly scaffold protein SufB